MGRSHACKLLNFHRDGAPMWNQLSIVPVRTVSGTVSHYVGMQTFTPATRPGPASGVAAHQRSGSYAVLPVLAEVQRAQGVQRSSSHAMLVGDSGFNSPAMVS